jgi:protein TonB
MASSKKTLLTDLLAIVFSISIHGGMVWALSSYSFSLWPSKVPREPVFVEVVDLPPAPEEKAEEPEEVRRFSHRSQKVEKEKTPRGTIRPGTVRPETVKTDEGEKVMEKKEARLVKPAEERTLAGPETLKEPAKEAEEPPGPVVSERVPASPEGSKTQEKVDRKEPGATAPAPPKEEASKLKLFPTEERLRELAKKYYEEEPEKEKGKVLTLNTSELKYSKYLLNLKRRIEFYWDYPLSSVRKGEQGRLRINFTITNEGDVKGIDVVKSSNYPALDDAAVTAIRLAAPFNPFPGDFGIEKIDIRASFEYHLIVYGDRPVRRR